MSDLRRTSAVVLAAGQGTRMKSALPKVLHPLAGRPLVHYPVRAALEAGCAEVVVVVGHGSDAVTSYLHRAFGDRVRTTLQAEQRGTGDAARVGLEAVSPDDEHVIVFYGDVPLVEATDVLRVIERLGQTPACTLALATCEVDEPRGYGRILRDAAGKVVGIREERDLQGDAERRIREINPGIYAASTAWLREACLALRPDNAQKELYLTDVVEMAAGTAAGVAAVASRAEVLVGVNDRAQLADAEDQLHARIAANLRRSGVTVRRGARIDDGVQIASDAVIDHGAVLRGATRVGPSATVGVGCVLVDALIGEEALIKPYSVVTESSVGARAQIGPFAHLRPHSEIGEEAHVGNFVETKKTTMGKGAKANHLAYLGDGVVGAGANVGAGTIFCNYDGFRKHTTVIGEGAFIGSDSQIVAPVTIGAGAYVATGTTVVRDVPADALAIGRAKQENKEGYASRLKARLKASK